MSCAPKPQEYVPMVMVNGHPRPMPPGGVLPSAILSFPPWAFQVKSTSIRDSSELGRRILTAQSTAEVKALLEVAQGGTPANVWVDSSGRLVTASAVVLDLPKVRDFVDFDYDALVSAALGA
jgi:hypothetical protein